LKIFCDVVELQSFSKAAQQNHISQSAVSQQISQLEQRFGERLVERGQGRLRLTEAGEIFYQGCKDILERFDRLKEQLSQLSNVIAGSVKVSTVYTIGLHELPVYLRQFMQTYPKAKVHVSYRRSNEVYDDVLTGNAHIGIVAFPTKHSQLDIKLCWRDNLVLICSPEHPFSQSDRIDIRQLHGEAFVAFERDIPTRKEIDRIFKKFKVTPRYTLTIDNVETIKRAVEIGAGVSIVPENTVQGEVEHQTLRAIPFTNGTFQRPIAIVTKKRRSFTRAQLAFIDLLTSGDGSSQ
jgi:DNA-binding transcriptional LysR family regulator